MIEFLCKLWPYLAGGLIGWLLAGWFARRLKHSQPPVEKIVEKIVEKQVDNPQHLSLISKLETENKEISGLRTKLLGFESATSKTVDNPAHLKKIKELESQVYNYKNSSKAAPQAAVSTVTKTVDNPQHLKRISELEAQLSKLENSTTNPTQTAISAKTKTVDNPVHLNKISELEAQLKDLKNSSANSNEVKTVDNPAHLSRIAELESQVTSLKQGPKIDLVAAKAAGYKLKSEDDLTAIEGIGPKINDLMKADGVNSFKELSDTPVSSIQTILDNAGPRYQIANPGTWPDQANLAANNSWPALKALQDVLVGGVYPDGSSPKNPSPSSDNEVNKQADAQTKTPDDAKTAQAVTAKSTPVEQSPVENTSVGVDKGAAKAAGFKVKLVDGKDDFTVIEGIGPKINGLIQDAGILRYSELGKTKVEAIQQILTDAGPRYSLAKPGTWPAQADFAAANKWDALKAWQDELDGGK